MPKYLKRYRGDKAKRQPVLIVFSGGQDSTTCLFWALKCYDHVKTVASNYSQRHSLEIEIAKHIAAEQGVKNHLLDMSLLGQLTENALIRDIAIENPDDDSPNTFVDGRNHLFLSFATVLARHPGITDIITGACETDFSDYPDYRDALVKSLNVTLNLAMDYNLVIQTPLMWFGRLETWELADQPGKFDYVRENTLMYHNGTKGSGCGECPACKPRQAGLEKYLTEKGQA